MQTAALWLVTLSCVAVLAGPIAARADAHDEDDHAHAPTVFVSIQQGHVRPEEQKITAGEAFGWRNYTSKIARVSFDKDVAKHLTCKSQGTFRLAGDRLESGDIQAQQFATLCSLAPGAYDYKVELRSGIGGGGGDTGKVFTGRIIVE
jgi:hypothetical protein